MKKTIIICVLFLCIGFLLERKILEKEQEETFYFLLEGIYQDKNLFEENTNNLRKKVLEYQNNKIYVYVAITKDIEIAKHLQGLYQKQNKTVEIESRQIKEEELKMNIEQFDILVKKAESEEEIYKIEEVVLANYEEIMKNREEV